MTHPVLQDGFSAYFDAWEAKIGSFIEHRFPKNMDPAHQSATASDTTQVSGLPFGVKDNIAVRGFGLSCGSRLLSDFISPYDATVVRRLMDCGAIPLGKTNMDEFGMGSSTDNSALKRTNNPWDSTRVAGGSSGGSAAAVASGLVPFALGSDTGGSIRQPAAFCGVPGLKPTYGAVSRFGLVAYASSLETIGIIADTVDRIRSVFSIIRGPDPLDMTTVAIPADAPPLRGSTEVGTKTIGILSPEALARAIADTSLQNEDETTANRDTVKAAATAAVLEPEVQGGFDLAVKRFKDMGYAFVDLELASLKYGVPAYYTIATAEASANLARFDGIRYGKRPQGSENPDALIDAARRTGFGDEVKLRILLGTFVLRSGFQDRYYLRAQRIRAGIRRDFDNAFTRCDTILMPVYPTRAFGRGEAGLSSFAQKAADLYTCCANLSGLPALSFPASLEGGLPVGLQLVGKPFGEGTLMDLVGAYEKEYPFPHPDAYRAYWS